MRWLAALVADLAHKTNVRELGSTVEVLVEGPSKSDAHVLVGHSPKIKRYILPCRMA